MRTSPESWWMKWWLEATLEREEDCREGRNWRSGEVWLCIGEAGWQPGRSRGGVWISFSWTETRGGLKVHGRDSAEREGWIHETEGESSSKDPEAWGRAKAQMEGLALDKRKDRWPLKDDGNANCSAFFFFFWAFVMNFVYAVLVWSLSNPMRRNYSPHLMGEDPKPWRGQETCPESLRRRASARLLSSCSAASERSQDWS